MTHGKMNGICTESNEDKVDTLWTLDTVTICPELNECGNMVKRPNEAGRRRKAVTFERPQVVQLCSIISAPCHLCKRNGAPRNALLA